MTTSERKQIKEKIFKDLSVINLGELVKKKLGLSYLSWANAWEIIKKYDADAEYTIYTRTVETSEVKKQIDSTLGVETTITNTYTTEYPYFTDGKTCWVKVGVTIDGIEEIETLAVMDNHQASVMAASVTSVAVNKAIQRAFVKACARHGLGLYLYQGEDLPSAEKEKAVQLKQEQEKKIKDIMNRADQLVVKVLDANAFKAVQTEAINLYSAILNDPNQAMIAELTNQYVAELFPGKRLSLLAVEDDSQNLQKLHSYLQEITKMISNNNNK